MSYMNLNVKNLVSFLIYNQQSSSYLKLLSLIDSFHPHKCVFDHRAKTNIGGSVIDTKRKLVFFKPRQPEKTENVPKIDACWSNFFFEGYYYPAAGRWGWYLSKNWHFKNEFDNLSNAQILVDIKVKSLTGNFWWNKRRQWNDTILEKFADDEAFNPFQISIQNEFLFRWNLSEFRSVANPLTIVIVGFWQWEKQRLLLTKKVPSRLDNSWLLNR